jgi:hypothetical protein
MDRSLLFYQQFEVQEKKKEKRGKGSESREKIRNITLNCSLSA